MASLVAEAAPARRPNLDTMPGEVMDAIAFYLSISSPGSRFDPIGSNEPPRDVDMSDTGAGWLRQPRELTVEELKARNSDFEEVPPAYATPPAQLPSLLLSCRHAYESLNARTSPRLYSRIFKTKFDYEAIERRFGADAVDPTHLTAELRRRCIGLKRIKRAVVTKQLWNPALTRAEAAREIEDNLWLAYLMMLENDGKNIIQLRWASIEAYVMMHYNEMLLTGLLSARYPPESVDRALSLHLQYLLFGNVALAKESMDHCEELMFVLRPYVFAAHKFDTCLAPWTIRDLPCRGETLPQIVPGMINSNGRGSTAINDPFTADLSVKNRASEIEHCGRRIKLVSPLLAHAAIAVFFQRVERDPQAMGLTHLGNDEDGEGTQSNGADRWELAQVFGDMNDATPADSEAEREERATRRRRRNLHDPTRLRSKDHDQDFARLVWCHDPTAGLGLKPSFHAGSFEGAWEGRFSFFDFDSYRDMLAGLMSSLYEGPFGEQPQVWKISERIVRLGPQDAKGGKGSILSAGYTGSATESAAAAFDAELSSDEGDCNVVRDRGRPLVLRPKKQVASSSQSWTWNSHDRSRRRQEGSGEYPSFGADELTTAEIEEYDDDPDKYEIQLSGTGHSAWGRFNLKGRIRSWDGMMIMKKEYTPDGRGRWLYRGYALAGGKLVGRWRDTFTPENMSGYEGCFCLFKRDDE